MTKTVKTFVLERYGRAWDEYEKEVGKISKWLNKDNKTYVHLSSDLFSRLQKEEGKLSWKVLDIGLSGVVVVNYEHPTIKTDLVIDVNSHYPTGHNSKFFGLKE